MPTSKSAEAGQPPLLITMGDPAGIGPEVAAAAYAALGGRIGDRTLRLVGDAGVFRSCSDVPPEAIVSTRAHAARSPGKAEVTNAIATIEAVTLAVEMALKGEACAVTTAPINKAVLMQAGFGFPGHTDYLAKLTGVPRAVMMLVSGQLRVIPLTVHIPIAEVPRAVTASAIVETAEIALAALRRDFSIPDPRLAIAGLNPHAGEEGALGSEEADVIVPAVAELKRRGHAVLGPLPADTMFHAVARAHYDAALCMYHDQALIPIKTLSFWDGVNVTLGLPIVRTSPDHGTGFDIAGKGLADPRSMIAAIRLAAKMADARALAGKAGSGFPPSAPQQKMQDDLPPLREVIAAHGLSAKKSLGQNFLLDLNLTRRIARAADPQGALVYEVGPGPGGLTRALLAEGATRVIAVERDERCLAALAEIADAYPGRLEIVAADALALDEAKLLRQRGADAPVRVAANLPYNIGTALLVKWLTAEVWPPFWSSLTLMFQREVADRITAHPGTHAYGRLSVLAQWRARAKILFDVSKSAFVPPPKVTSAIVRIEPLREPVAPARLRDLETMTAVSFGQRRKMLRHSLKNLTQDAEALIREAGIDPVLRPEQLSVAEFASLARAWAKRIEKPISHVRE